LSASAARAQQPAAPAGQAQQVSNARSSQRRRHDLNFIKPDKVADFEMVMGKLKEALAKSENPQRKQQAASWKVFKSADPAGATTSLRLRHRSGREGRRLPVSNIIAEAFPAEAERDPEEVRRLLRAGDEHPQPHRPARPRQVAVRISDSVLRRCGALASSAHRFPV
jgi:hypothetical protein